jgi:transposase
MLISDSERQEVIDMYLSGKYYNTEIAEWLGISISSVRKIIRNYQATKNGQSKN